MSHARGVIWGDFDPSAIIAGNGTRMTTIFIYIDAIKGRKGFEGTRRLPTDEGPPETVVPLGVSTTSPFLHPNSSYLIYLSLSFFFLIAYNAYEGKQ